MNKIKRITFLDINYKLHLNVWNTIEELVDNCVEASSRHTIWINTFQKVSGSRIAGHITVSLRLGQ